MLLVALQTCRGPLKASSTLRAKLGAYLKDKIALYFGDRTYTAKGSSVPLHEPTTVFIATYTSDEWQVLKCSL